MRFLLKLKNKENNFIGGIYLLSQFSDDLIKDIFNSAIEEYAWSEDNSLENALNVLTSVSYLLNKNKGGLVYQNKTDISKKAEFFVKKNLFETVDLLTNFSIFLEKRWLSLVEREVDEIIELAEPINTIY